MSREVLFETNGLATETWEAATRATALPLSTLFEELPARASCTSVRLGPLANRLELSALRRFLHRASHLLEPGGSVSFLTRDPDAYPDEVWPGTEVEFAGRTERVRPLRHLLELLRLFPLRPRTPVLRDEVERLLEWKAVRLADPVPPLDGSTSDARERYAPDTPYRRFDRLEEPETADDLLYAASRLRPQPGARVLALGVNDGRELEMFPPAVRDAVELWGIDHSARAIEEARARFPRHASRMRLADLAELSTLGLPSFDDALLLNVLHCTSVDRDRLLSDLFPLLKPQANVLVSIPNCHFGVDGILRRPLRRDDPRHDRSLVFKDARALARRLYRAGFRTVETFGTLDVFLLARRVADPDASAPPVTR